MSAHSLTPTEIISENVLCKLSDKNKEKKDKVTEQKERQKPPPLAPPQHRCLQDPIKCSINMTLKGVAS